MKLTSPSTRRSSRLFNARARRVGFWLPVIVTLACSSNGDPTTSTGGSASIGGASSTEPTGTGGANSSSTGGSQTTGGTTSLEATGGIKATGGAATTGGSGAGGAGEGGAKATGGAPNTGGALTSTGGQATGIGGASTTGGVKGSGGTTLVAGTSSQSPTGGASAGGSKASGGSSAAGGGTSEAATCPVPAGAEMPEASVPAGYCAWVFAEGLTSPRGMVADSKGQLVLIEAGNAGAVTLLWDANGDRVNQTTERMRIATVSGLNHGVAIYGDYLYASTATTVYRWPYDGSHAALADRETVLSGMPAGGNHSTRTLAFDPQGNLFINIGSANNIDSNSNRARVVRLDAAKIAAGNANYATDVTVQADGTRNEVGLRFDSQGRLWGVENGLDDLNRSDLGGDIHNDNPGEELNLFDKPGAFYGYPYCWSEGNLPSGVGMGKGTQWATPNSMNDGTHSDTWCRDTANVQLPRAVMQAHSAPLDVLFYQGSAFPSDMVGNAIITFHGSWNRSPATGYKVVVAAFGSDGMPTGTVTSLLESAASGDTGGGWTHRPVALAVGNSGELYVTSDADGLVMVVGHE